METKINKILLNTIKLGDLNLRNRFVMAPLTRMRAENNLGIPNEMHVKYYSERAKESGFSPNAHLLRNLEILFLELVEFGINNK